MESLPAIRKLRSTTRPFTRGKRSAKQSPKKRAPEPYGNGFLKHCFQPLWRIDAKSGWKEMEAEFFRSLDNLCKFYKLEIPDTSNLSFPENMRAAYEQVRRDTEQNS